MRTPTPKAVLYAWYNERVAAGAAADALAPFVNDPQCGFYKRQLVKGGPFVPARIFMDREVDPGTGELLSDEILCCEVLGEDRDPETEWLWLWENVIAESEFHYMTACAYHDAWHNTEAPGANPKKPIDWLKVKSAFNK